MLGSYFQESQNYNAQAKPITHHTADTQILIWDNCLYIASTDNGRKWKLCLKKKKRDKKMLRDKQENPNQHSVLHADNRNQCEPISISSWLTEFVRHLVH